jgi:dsDNA-specific endonuclease/ATPase MutS2
VVDHPLGGATPEVAPQVQSGSEPLADGLRSCIEALDWVASTDVRWRDVEPGERAAMTFAPGDRVHLAGIGTGIVREVRGGRRFAVEIKGRIVIAALADLERADPPRRVPDAPSAPSAPSAPGRTQPHLAAPGAPSSAPGRTQPSLDLHCMTVEQALAAVEVWVNDELLAGHGEARVIHGRGGGRLKSAVHQYLRGLSAVASFRIDPQNPGVTIVTFA